MFSWNIHVENKFQKNINYFIHQIRNISQFFSNQFLLRLIFIFSYKIQATSWITFVTKTSTTPSNLYDNSVKNKLKELIWNAKYFLYSNDELINSSFPRRKFNNSFHKPPIKYNNRYFAQTFVVTRHHIFASSLRKINCKW